MRSRSIRRRLTTLGRVGIKGCICVSRAIPVSSPLRLRMFDVPLSTSEQELATDPLFERLEAPKGDELRHVRFASEGGEHAREVGG
jgi:hypothetical protein